MRSSSSSTSPNEWSGLGPSYATTYAAAITLLREAGVHHTLVIDASDWGQNMASLLSAGPSLLEGDPEHNLLFSVHMYRQHFPDSASVRAALRGAAKLELPFIVGEFGSAELLDDGLPGVIPFAALLEEAQRLRLGYLPWVWTGFGNGPGSMDLSADGSAAQLTSWGDAVINGPFGIRATSEVARMFGD